MLKKRTLAVLFSLVMVLVLTASAFGDARVVESELDFEKTTFIAYETDEYYVKVTVYNHFDSNMLAAANEHINNARLARLNCCSNPRLTFVGQATFHTIRTSPAPRECVYTRSVMSFFCFNCSGSYSTESFRSGCGINPSC